ncbi:hypothetical protein FISHEDRAFT_66508 [Fistulina hepatica ATCC 64428]|uniref:HAT C-terminal dimerisation domain-containing protein n=1 Tax=Fistulina hepatica ATCC 64428 TaxID=1128425 RepID=A0A0D7A8N2_9AGAR|nr:hypothetical protein FISHEDRAFT_66508 [Fistulina hepatica ATCC 64428]
MWMGNGHAFMAIIMHYVTKDFELGRALDYQEAIDAFVAKTKDLRKYELSEADWQAITLVTQWLKSFCSATTQMSMTKKATLSFTHAVFRGLQESVRQSLKGLPDSATPYLKQGLLKAHRKLSDYYYKFDESTLYVWASIMDPRITLAGLLEDANDDSHAMDHINEARELPCEPFSTCDPLKWWQGHLLSIPGSAVAVEHIFSGGQDTIALRRTSLKLETIWILMLVKQYLRLAWVAAKALIVKDM